jgi:catechol 2,3-dioxygenase-like lactoylglutathione lyase family enzyme
MITHFDHVTIVVRDIEAAKQFFSLLGFIEDKSVVIAGQPFSAYMGVEGIEAEHVTLALANVSPRTEVQLLKYLSFPNTYSIRGEPRSMGPMRPHPIRKVRP